MLPTPLPTAASRPQPRLLPALAFNQLVSWGTLYYAFTVLSPAVQRDLGAGADAVNGAFSLALLVWGLATYPAGLVAQRHGARTVLMAGALAAALGFAALRGIGTLGGFYLAWVLLGAAMAMTLYEPAFAAIVQSSPDGHRRRIGLLTVAGGFASSLFWPLSHALDSQWGWRDTCLAFAGLQLLAGLAAASLPHYTEAGAQPTHPTPQQPPHPARHARHGDPRLFKLAACFALYGFVTSALAFQLAAALGAQGLDAEQALALAALVGPMQALGRAADLALASRWPPRRVGTLTFVLLPLSTAALWLAYWHGALNAVFIACYGLGLGLLTIVRASAPLELFGPQAYARHGAAMSAPSVLARAAGPLLSTWVLALAGGQQALVAVLALAALLGSALYASARTGPQDASALDKSP